MILRYPTFVIAGVCIMCVLQLDANWIQRLKHSTVVTRSFSGMEDRNSSLLIETEGCSIPNFHKRLKFTEVAYTNQTCGKRIVFVIPIFGDKIIFEIDPEVRNSKSVGCCYAFVKEDLKYSTCKQFRHGDVVTLEGEVIVVTCTVITYRQNKFYTVFTYNDAYLILKKKKRPENPKKKWNVLLIGMDSVSRGRAYLSLPKLVKYFHENEWLDFRGYNKVGDNTYPNTLSLLTGKHQSQFSWRMEKDKNLIWKRYKEAGYITAYGEEAKNYHFTLNNFSDQPTDHFARTYFNLKYEWRNGLKCTYTQTSALTLLEYARQFTEAYKNDNFFGLFWLSFLSHDPSDVLIAAENPLINYFEFLKDIGILKNTFVFFYSDHGANFGPNRISIEAYYDDRLPMFFMWVPQKFRDSYYEEYRDLGLNQYRLITPFDFHATLWQILKLSNKSLEIVPPKGCLECKGLFSEISENRTCEDINIDEAFCVCHRLRKTKRRSSDYNISLRAAIRKITDELPHLISPASEVIRHHWYKRGNKKMFLIVFIYKSITYEVILEKKSDSKYGVIYSKAI